MLKEHTFSYIVLPISQKCRCMNHKWSQPILFNFYKFIVSSNTFLIQFLCTISLWMKPFIMSSSSWEISSPTYLPHLGNLVDSRCGPCPQLPSMSFCTDFIQILSPDFIQIISRFFPPILSRFFRNSLYPDFIQILSQFYPDFLETHFIQILSWFYLDKIWIKSG